MAALRALALAAIVLTGACAPGTPSSEPSPEPPRKPAAFEEGEPYRPRIDPANFVAVIDNPYLPLRPGTTLIYEGMSGGEREVVKVTVTDDTKDILGITATVVRDRVFVEGKLAEDTFDWYGQDRQGNVWYLGEDTKEYENGKVVSTEGSWEAGVDGAQPGIIMLGDPQPSDTYRQEFYEGEAEDVARVLALDESVTVPYGSFDGVLRTEDWTPLEPKIRENKFYARGIGVVFERLVRGGKEVLRLVGVKSGP
jgi:hypothetical protein